MTESVQPAEKDLVGIKGWLLFYVITTIIVYVITTIIGVLWVGTDPTTEAYSVGLVITPNALGLYLIFKIRKPITQTYHIWLNLILAGFSAFGSIQLDMPSGWPAVLVMLVWASYWIRSKRVRATYCQDTGQGG